MWYIKIHQKYLLNKFNIIVISIIIILFSVIIITNLNNFSKNINWFYYEEVIFQFIDTLIIYTKLILIPLSCLLFGSAFIKEQDEYHLLFCNFYIIKGKYYFFKIIMLAFIILVIVLSNYLILTFLGYTCSNWYFNDKKIVELYLNMYFILIIYGLLGVICSVLIPSNFSYVIPEVLFVIGEIIGDFDENKFIKIFGLFFPTLYSGDVITLYGTWHLIVIMVIYFMISHFLYLNKKY